MKMEAEVLMTERDEAFQLANAVLDAPNFDPDRDLAVLARQFLRETERSAKAFEAGVSVAAAIASNERPAPTMDEIQNALVAHYDAMLEDMEAFINKPHEEKTEAEATRERAAMDRYHKTEGNVMRLSYPLWRAQNLTRSITTNAHCDGRTKGFLPPFPVIEEV